MSTPNKVRYGNAVYRKATPEEVINFLVTAAAPRTQEEWKNFAEDVYKFYAAQLADMDTLDDAAQVLRGVANTIGAIDQMYQAAQQSMDVRPLRDAMSNAQVVRMRSLKQALPMLKQQFKKLNAVKNAKKAHEKLKKRIGKMSQSSGLKHWFK